MMKLAKQLQSIPSRRRWLGLALFVTISLLAIMSACTNLAASNGDNPEEKVKVDRPAMNLVVDEDALADSIHADLDCTDCHEEVQRDENDDVISASEVYCDSCHDEPMEALDASIHGSNSIFKDGVAARCQDCHGAHNIMALDNPQSPLTKRRVSKVCANCHSRKSAEALLDSKELVYEDYIEGVHGKSLVIEGTVVSPSCLDCHGEAHTLKTSSDEDGPTNHQNVDQLCGECHIGIVEPYQSSVHGELVSDGEEAAPTCSTCHGAHLTQRTGNTFKIQADRVCGSCHEKAYELHRQTYHGRVKALGGTQVAGCYDCHGAHAIHTVDSGNSPVSPQNKIETCRRCHPGAPVGFAGYLAHGDPNDASKFPTLYWSARSTHILIIVAFIFLILHTLGWNWRRRNDPLDPNVKEPGKRPFRMFRGIDRFCYSITVGGFVLLALSGLPLRFYMQSWAQMTFKILGGSQIAAYIHRLGASLVFLALVIHIASLVTPLWKARIQTGQSFGSIIFGKNSPFPGLNDFRLLWHHLKWILGMGPRPKPEGWLYWEKLDYLAMIIGISILAVTGLTMWIPEIMTLFLPGWFLNVSQIVHDNEAVLALLFFIAIHLTHFWNHRKPRMSWVD